MIILGHYLPKRSFWRKWSLKSCQPDLIESCVCIAIYIYIETITSKLKAQNFASLYIRAARPFIYNNYIQRNLQS